MLPSLTLILGEIAIYSRYQRSAMLDVLGADYVRTAQAKGLSRRRALFKHALRTALIPSATFFAYSFGLLLVGATFTEKIFGWHGMGEWFVDSVTKNDVNAVAAVSCFAAVLVLVAGLLSDIAYASSTRGFASDVLGRTRSPRSSRQRARRRGLAPPLDETRVPAAGASSSRAFAGSGWRWPA